ncbi:MAG: lysylphosphatidylglycerol synthase domain-containing protein [Roseovarius sp.]|jgi:uncharacterized membrane protein YbhN (UPF0104 family)|uniref:lysylphosphatidylglycerol synthase domain-containing protein n=1 Tax=Roseovarius sp. TaxID=1486281 RepID=UPI0032EAA636
MNLKHLTEVAGFALVAASLAYLGREILVYHDSLSLHSLPVAIWTRLAALGFVYGAAMLFLAEQWHRIIGLFGEEPRRRTWPSYTSTLVARYLPGNVFHIVGRMAWLRRGGLSDSALLRSSALELALTPVAAGILLLPFLPFLPQPIPIISFVIAAFILIAVAAHPRLRSLAFSWLPRLAPALIFGLAFMAVLAGVFVAVANAVSPVAPQSAVAVALGAWLAGYATPGAPGGIGVREATIVVLLSQTISPESAVLVALLFRGVTIVGDVVCFLLGTAARKAVR